MQVGDGARLPPASFARSQSQSAGLLRPEQAQAPCRQRVANLKQVVQLPASHALERQRLCRGFQLAACWRYTKCVRLHGAPRSEDLRLRQHLSRSVAIARPVKQQVRSDGVFQLLVVPDRAEQMLRADALLLLLYARCQQAVSWERASEQDCKERAPLPASSRNSAVKYSSTVAQKIATRVVTREESRFTRNGCNNDGENCRPIRRLLAQGTS